MGSVQFVHWIWLVNAEEVASDREFRVRVKKAREKYLMAVDVQRQIAYG